MHVSCYGADGMEIINFICDSDSVNYLLPEEHQFEFSTVNDDEFALHSFDKYQQITFSILPSVPFLLLFFLHVQGLICWLIVLGRC